MPFGPSGQNPSQNIAAPVPQPGSCVIVQNTGAVVVYVSDNQALLDKVDATNTPTQGFILQPLGQPGDTRVIEVVTSGLWARCAAPGGSAECIAWPNC